MTGNLNGSCRRLKIILGLNELKRTIKVQHLIIYGFRHPEEQSIGVYLIK